MKASDFIVEFLISKGVTDTFGYPGGMVTHLMDSFQKYRTQIKAHVNYNEQGAAFAACGYAQISNKMGVSYATSGPGFTNLVTGIANAYFDSIPVLFITGQVNTYEQLNGRKMRQMGFQEMNVIDIAKPITKYTTMISDAEDLPYELEKAYTIATSGRKGPVVIDIPMNIFRQEIAGKKVEFIKENNIYNEKELEEVFSLLKNSKNPLVLVGNGVSISNSKLEFREFIKKYNLPVISSMIAIDCMANDEKNYFGFIGSYGHRYANFLTEKCDLLLTIGSRLPTRQTGVKREDFAINAKIVRIDVDEAEFDNPVNKQELQVKCDIPCFLKEMLLKSCDYKVNNESWLNTCKTIKEKLSMKDELSQANRKVIEISELIEDNVCITTDVGQNQVWVAQHFKVKEKQRVLFSGGHGAMGYSLPSAIGCYYAAKSKVVSFNGDGGFQMNIQELQFIAREKLPIKIIVINNNALGMIRHFQEMYFDSVYTQTVEGMGYTNPNFVEVAKAYGIRAFEEENLSKEELKELLADNDAVLITVNIPGNSYVFPKLAMGKPIYDQEPLLEEQLIQELLRL